MPWCPCPFKNEAYRHVLYIIINRLKSNKCSKLMASDLYHFYSYINTQFYILLKTFERKLRSTFFQWWLGNPECWAGFPAPTTVGRTLKRVGHIEPRPHSDIGERLANVNNSAVSLSIRVAHFNSTNCLGRLLDSVSKHT